MTLTSVPHPPLEAPNTFRALGESGVAALRHCGVTLVFHSCDVSGLLDVFDAKRDAVKIVGIDNWFGLQGLSDFRIEYRPTDPSPAMEWKR